MITQDPGSQCEAPRRAANGLRSAYLVERLGDLVRTSSMRAPQLRLANELRHDESEEDEDGSDQLEVVGAEAPCEEPRPPSGGTARSPSPRRQSQTHLVGADQGFADDDAGEPPDDHANAHADVRESLILASSAPESATKPLEIARPKTIMFCVVDAERANHLHVVAGGAHGHAEVGAEETDTAGARQRDGKSDGAKDRSVADTTSQPARLKDVTPRMSSSPIRSDCVAKRVDR